jgi:hypothetical protein
MKILLCLLIPIVVFGKSNYQPDQKNPNNPFFKEWDTPFQTPPFN